MQILTNLKKKFIKSSKIYKDINRFELKKINLQVLIKIIPDGHSLEPPGQTVFTFDFFFPSSFLNQSTDTVPKPSKCLSHFP
jgi:hypothetical protein